ncbi:hypothetical protein COT94_01160 [Candidatus Falkowbacteria bacterium CG10_big_fil_rev_8_21_14_0_10_37_14]|uniref:Acyltransferase 3 domain-containing protein n=1 Tax=Candidatus Falkowbacteria bacterium CG10_big_fil_rev_8_21_14_0_10_37_14 TaxID=1974561 RepID=A0A2M6WU16_9BACT|nr:acyltransferase [Candidatus Falkowbacteria bacterium]PIT96283.1 MAG: hypothetical protein COT94_01160 [Candidatus Falkowbacteria bacterium CG10_big_fil_rev_8_21_14_0_10_37_14]
MIFLIVNPIWQTIIFSLLLMVPIVWWRQTRTDKNILPITVSFELKGLAILLVVFSHIGYFLDQGKQFLWPLSNLAGVGVDIFLLLSGYGLAMSALTNKRKILEFYRRHFLKLFVPLWLVLILWFSAAFFSGWGSYDWHYILLSLLGWFPGADIYQDVNSPLWYFSLIAGYYVLFPVFFKTRWPWLSALAIYSVAYLIFNYIKPQIGWTARLYELHLLAFPIGVGLASVLNSPKLLKVLEACRRPKYYYLILNSLFLIISYRFLYAINIKSLFWLSVDSLLSTFLFTALFVIKKQEWKTLSLFGLLSYEIYLLHWPWLYHYGGLLSLMPAWLAGLIYLGLFLIAGWLLSYLVKKINSVTLHAANKADKNLAVK